MQKDSNGNLLPNHVWLHTGASQDDIGAALTVNTFLLAAKIALESGKTVIYDKESKMATITDQEGNTLYISHD